MRYFTPVALLCTLLFFTFSSCQKNLTDDTPGVDSSIFSPKQIIFSNATSPSLKQYYSLKYAADKSRIDLYLDDTTNSNPYDELTVSYIFNSSGYFIKYLSQFHNSGRIDSDSIFINRSGDNKIISITESFKRPGVRLTKDTSIFKYANLAGGTIITVESVSANYDILGGLDFLRDTTAYTYNAANNLQTVKKKSDGHTSSGMSSISYNTNGSLKSIHYADNYNGSSDATFFYNSGLPDGKEDYLSKLLLGNDYYLQDIRIFPSPGNRYDGLDCCIISSTNTQHISMMHVVSNLTGVSSPRDYNFTYQQNKYLLPVSILELGDHQLAEFRY